MPVDPRAVAGFDGDARPYEAGRPVLSAGRRRARDGDAGPHAGEHRRGSLDGPDRPRVLAGVRSALAGVPRPTLRFRTEVHTTTART